MQHFTWTLNSIFWYLLGCGSTVGMLLLWRWMDDGDTETDREIRRLTREMGRR